MARNDVITDVHIAISGSSTVDVQPASGDEWNIQFASTGQTSDVSLIGYDGSSQTGQLLWAPHAGGTAYSAVFNLVAAGERFDLWLTNSQYIRFLENAGNAEEIAYYGIKTKD